MSRNLYAVTVEGIGVVQVARDRIADARAWAAAAFGRTTTSVRPIFAQRRTCPGCESRPCCCPATGGAK